MSADPNKKTPRQFQCRESLWQKFEQMARELECSVDYLINDAMKQYARQRGYTNTGAVSAPPSPSSSMAGAPPPPHPPLSGSGAMPLPAPPVPSPLPSTASSGAMPLPIPPPPTAGSGAMPLPGRTAPPLPLPPPPAARRGAFPPAPPPPAARRAAAPPGPPGRSAPPGISTHRPAVAAPPITHSPEPAYAPAVAPGARSLAIHYQGEMFPVTKDRFIIGRGKQTSDLTIKDPNVSRQHAMIEFLNGQYYIVDMGSTNGVEYNGQRIQRKVIGEGDIFRVCDHELRFSYLS